MFGSQRWFEEFFQKVGLHLENLTENFDIVRVIQLDNIVFENSFK